MTLESYKKHHFSVLIPMYIGSNQKHCKLAIDSVLNQTLLPSEILLLLDGPISIEVDRLIKIYQKSYANLFRVISFPINRGLGPTLRDGVLEARYDIIARMDSDDICRKNRFEKQIDVLCDKSCDVVGSLIQEFDEGLHKKTSIRRVPCSNDEIYKFSRKRNPFNHMTVMYRKSSVIAAGNYSDFKDFEDYALWLAMIDKGFHMCNINEILVDVRAGGEMYMRRGDLAYIKHELDFQIHALKKGYIDIFRFTSNVLQRTVVRIIPNRSREFIYKIFLRDKAE